ALEALVHDREPTARPHDQLHLVLAPVEEHEHVAAEGVVAERVPDLVDQTVERFPEADRLAGEVHAHRAWNEDHDEDLVTSLTTAATHVGDAFPTSMVTSFGSRTTSSAFLEMIVAGTNASARRGSVVSVANRFRHRYSRSGTRPRLRENSAIVT